MRNGFRIAALLLALSLGIAGCSEHASDRRPASTMTEAQRDSAIARSQIPGAHAVARAFQFANKTSRATVDPDTLDR